MPAYSSDEECTRYHKLAHCEAEPQKPRHPRPSGFPTGACVKLHGLTGARKLNGRQGVVKEFVESTGRFSVELEKDAELDDRDGDSSKAEIVKAKPENLVIVVTTTVEVVRPTLVEEYGDDDEQKDRPPPLSSLQKAFEEYKSWDAQSSVGHLATATSAASDPNRGSQSEGEINEAALGGTLNSQGRGNDSNGGTPTTAADGSFAKKQDHQGEDDDVPREI